MSDRKHKPGTSEAKTRLLIVDDDETNRYVLCSYLRQHGYVALGVEDGQTALTALGSGSFDLVLLDHMMPGMSGMETLSIIRKTHDQTQLPVIMATAKSDASDVVDALHAGANDYVTKPFDMPMLLQRISTRLTQDRSEKPAAAKPPRSKAPAPTPTPPSKPKATPHFIDREPSLRSVKVGSILADHYRLDEEIGAGVFGKVYKGVHLQRTNEIAIKVLQIPAQAEAGLARFRRAGVSACRIQHKNAVGVSDYGVTSSGVAFLVMDLLDGEGLDEVLMRNRALSVQQCAEILVPVCSVLASAHARGIVHCDIKPRNIFLAEEAGKTVVKVLDFGVAKFVGQESISALAPEEPWLGTPPYAAPERLRGQPYDGRADVYSLGVLLYKMLSGHQPFEGVASLGQNQESPTPLNEVKQDARGNALRVSSAIARVVARAMSPDPAARQSVELLAVDFSQAVHS